jgi:hypothetical protein
MTPKKQPVVSEILTSPLTPRERITVPVGRRAGN